MISESPITVEQLINYITLSATLDDAKDEGSIHNYEISFLPEDDDTYVDIYIRPVVPVEFIYVPIKIKND